MKTVKTHGVGGLYRGLTSLLIGTAPKASLRFTVFSQVSKFMQDDKGKTSAFGTWFAGAMAGLTEATLVVTPVETMKTKLIHDQVHCCFVLPVACYVLPAACYVLPAACYVLPAACCMLLLPASAACCCRFR